MWLEIYTRKADYYENRNITNDEIKKVLIYKDKIRWLIPGANHSKNNGLCQEIFLYKFDKIKDKNELLWYDETGIFVRRCYSFDKRFMHKAIRQKNGWKWEFHKCW